MMQRVPQRWDAAQCSRLKSLSAYFLIGCLAALFLVGCHAKSCEFEPIICYVPPPCLLEALPSAFPPLSDYEAEQDWGKELLIAETFGQEMDLYRAITSFKRALILIQQDSIATRERIQQVEYGIVLCYYLGGKYHSAITAFEESSLISVPPQFPPFRDLLILLYDAYVKVDQKAKALNLLNLIETTDCSLAEDLVLSTAITTADFALIDHAKETHRLRDEVDCFLECYCQNHKSVKKAQMLNAVLPGAGYAYVDQPQAAFTSFLINALFTAAAWQLFDRGYIPAGLIVTSLEMGWYFGGINGAGLAAREWNERLYADSGKELLRQDRLFPILMFQTAF